MWIVWQQTQHVSFVEADEGADEEADEVDDSVFADIAGPPLLFGGILSYVLSSALPVRASE